MFYQRVIVLCFALLTLPLHAAEPTETQRAVWANEAIVSAYTYSFQNFLPRQKEIAQYFTSKAWIAYSKALQDSKLPESVQKNSYVVSAVATSPPIITALNANEWRAIMPLLVVYKNPQYQQKQTLEVTVDFIQTDSNLGVRGMAIENFHAKIVTLACKCPPNDVIEEKKVDEVTMPNASSPSTDDVKIQSD